MTYERARKDFEYLESLDEFEDQICILDQVQDFMKEPTKAFATGLYRSSIEGWIAQHRDSELLNDRKVKTIIKRHDIYV